MNRRGMEEVKKLEMVAGEVSMEVQGMQMSKGGKNRRKAAGYL